MRFTEGEQVLARQPNTMEYSKGKITSVWGDKYKIQFSDGIEYIVYENDIKVERPSRSTARMSMRVARKSPTRSPSRKSQSRGSPARSPRRSTRSPGRSPARSATSNRKLPLRSTRFAKVSLPRIEVSEEKNNVNKNIISTQNVNEDDSPTDIMPLQFRLRESGVVTRRSARISSSTTRSETEHKAFIVTRNIQRAVSLPVEHKNQVRDLDGKERGYSVQRDQSLATSKIDEDVQLEATLSEKRKIDIKLVNQPQEWGGWIGTFILIFLLPASIILPQLICTKVRCITTLSVLISTYITSYINLYAMFGYAGFLTLLAVFSCIPIGKYIDGQQDKTGILKYRINGMLSAVLFLIVFGVCEYNDIPVSKFILENIVQLSISGWILGTLLALMLYLKANKGPVVNLNIHASTNSIIYNFWQGKEINPRIGPLDIKIILLRASIIGMIMINSAILANAVDDVGYLSINSVKSAVFVVSFLQILYCLDMLFFESNFLTSFEIMYEGTGYMICTAHLLYPFLPTLVTRFVLYNKTQLDYVSGVFIFLFIFGYIIYRLSNSQKNRFRRNPLSHSFNCMETISTTRGKKLLAFGLWAYVRHPNYFGDIVMQWAISFMSLSLDILPYYAAICCTLALMYRAIRDNARCKTRYGISWEQYCYQVKHKIFRHIF